jgi:cytochrome bd-type quinol oxidase subunit 2
MAVNASNIGSNIQSKLPQQAEGTTLTNILNNTYIIAGIICVIILVAAGIYYALSAGRSEHLTQAKRAIQYAIIGLVVVASAFAITNFIFGNL